MASRESTHKAETPEPVKLEMLAASQFQTREAVREFVAGSDFDVLGMMVCDALEAEETLDEETKRAANVGGFFLAQDLFRLARLAADADTGGFLPPVSDVGWRFTNKAEWLASVQAVSVASSTQPQGVAAVVARQMRALESEESAAFKAARCSKHKRAA